MTNAMRGFNMVLNETNAQNVNDVYSNLAAKTASNVDEISTAMTKVASLANNANMSFENTAAFLSQIIETTRESAETAGTALKTVIARFSEVKKLYSTGDLIGSDSEGESIDVNKVSTALRSAGVNLNEYLTGAKGLDDIFIELAQKWGTLDQVQQRYIATMAAGSRQQSRFIALMSDSARLTQLVTVANNSAGASNEQYEKTLDSLQSKLASLNNSWNTFTMSLANSTVIKDAVSALDGLLSGLNGITGVLGNTNSSIAKFVVTIGSFKLLKPLVGSFMKDMVDQVKGQGKSFVTVWQTMWQKFLQGFKNFKSFKGIWLELGKQASQSYISLPVMLQTEGIKDQAEAIRSEIYDSFNGTINTSRFAEDVFKGKDLGQYIQKLENLDISAEEARTTVNKLASQLNELQKTAKANAPQVEQTEKTLEVISQRASALSTIFMGTSLVLGIVGKQLQTGSGKTKQYGNALSSLATTFIIVSVAIKGLTASLKSAEFAATAFGTAIKAALTAATSGIGIIVVAIAAVVTSLVTVWKNVYSEEAQLERLQEAAEKAKEAADGAKNAYDTVIESTTKYDEAVAALGELETGTKEWKEQLQQVNTIVGNLLKEVPEMAQFFSIGDNGQYEINWEDAKNYAQNKASETALISTTASEQVTFKDKESSLAKAVQNYAVKQVIAYINKNYSDSIKTDDEGSLVLSLSYNEVYFDNLVEIISDKIQKMYKGNPIDFLLKGSPNVFGIGSFNFADSDQEAYEIIRSFGYGNLGADIAASYAQAEVTPLATLFWEAVYNEKYIKALADGDEDEISDITNTILIGEQQLQLTELDPQSAYLLSGKTDNLTIKDLNQISGMTQPTQELQNALSDVPNLAPADIQTGIVPQIETARTVRGKLAKDLGYANSNGIVDITSFVEDFGTLPLAMVRDLATNLKGSKKAIAQTYKDMFISVYEGLSNDPELQSEVGNLLSTVDLKSGNSIMATMQRMYELKIPTDKIREFYTTALEVSKPYIKSVEDLVKITEKYGEKYEELEKIRTALNKGTATQEQIDLLRSYGVDINSNNVYNTGKGFKAANDEELQKIMQTAYGSFKDYVNVLSVMISNATKQANDFYTNNNDLITYDETTGQYALSKTQNNIQGQEWNKIRGVLESSGLYTATQLDQGKQSNEEYHNMLYGYLQAIATILNEQGAMELGFAGVKSPIDLATYTSASEARAFRASSGVQQQLTLQQGEELGLKEDDIWTLANDLRNSSGIFDGMDSAQILEIAKNMLAAQEACDTLSKSWEDLKEIMSDSDKSSVEYYTTIQQLRKIMQQMTGTTTNFSNKFLTSSNTLKLFEEAANGSTEAVKKLMRAAAKDTIELSLGEEKFTTKLDNMFNLAMDYIENLDENSIITPNMDDENILTQFADLLLQSGATVDQINEIFGQMGIAPDIQWREVTSSAAFNWSQKGYTPYVKDTSANGITYGYKPYDSDNYTDVSQTFYIPMVGGKKKSVPKPKTSASSKSGGSGKKSSGNSSSSKKETWNNPYDKLYNLNEKINEALRQREKIERTYNKILKDRQSTYDELYKATLQEIANLKKEIDYQKQLQQGRKEQITQLASKQYTSSEGTRQSYMDWKVSQYASYDFDTNTISINWDKINSITDKEKGAAVESYIKDLETLVESFESTEETIDEMNDKIEEIRDMYKESYLELENRILEALVYEEQSLIDEISAIDESLNESTNRIFDSLQDSIEYQRQIRDNTKKEENIDELQRRLAYLKLDTSGANDLEIMKLEDQLQEAQESYADTLIDQQLNEARDQADKASEERQRQIEIMEANLEASQKNGDLWERVYELIIDSIDPSTGTFNYTSQMFTLLKNSEAFQGMSEFGKMEWIDELISNWMQAQSGLSEYMLTKAKEDGIVDTNQGTLVYDSLSGSWIDDNNNTYSEVEYNATTGKYTATRAETETVDESIITDYKTNEDARQEDFLKVGGYDDPVNEMPYDEIIALQNGLNKIGLIFPVTGVYDDNTINAVQTLQKKLNGYEKAKLEITGIYDELTRKWALKRYAQYKSGGLATETGLAWLDGTKTQPELVLNAQDTQKFLDLTNVLRSIKSISELQNGGDNYYEVHINVDELANDYDVDQLANRIKKLITNDANYRNVNAVSMMR